MKDEEADNRTMMILVGIVALVVVTGVVVVSDDPPVGRVVHGTVIDECAACSGSPVCAAKGKRVLTYESACDAACDGARKVSDGPCEQLRVVGA